MQLTQKTDFALRGLIYLHLNSDRLVSIKEISEAYDISYHHMVKALQDLIQKGYIESKLGKGGGLQLNKEASDISIGEIVRITENHFNIFECFDVEHSKCVITSRCMLKGLMNKAKKAFLEVLDSKTLADVAVNGKQLEEILN